MYKKRFAKWGFQKNSKSSAVTRRALKRKDECKRVKSRKASQPEELGSMKTFPGLDRRDSLTLIFLTTVRTWSAAFFESVHYRDGFPQLPQAGHLRPSKIKEISFSLRLVVDLLDRGHGHLAGRMARKAFLLVEDMLTLEGPALVWNLLEILYFMVTLHHTQLFHMLLAHIIGLADGRLIKTHPLSSMLRSLQKLVEGMTTVDHWLPSSALPYLLEQAWTLNAEILFQNFDTRLFQLYCNIRWESCSINPPKAIMFTQLEAQQVRSASTVAPKAEEPLENTIFEEDSMAQRLFISRMDASPLRDYEMLRASSVATLREKANSILSRGPSFNGDSAILLRMLAGLVTARMLEGLPAIVESRLHAGSVACAIRSSVDLNTEHHGDTLGEYLDVVERHRAIVALRGYAEGETDPQVVQEMWLLQDALVAAGEYKEAQEVERDSFRRMEEYIQDIPIDSVYYGKGPSS